MSRLLFLFFCVAFSITGTAAEKMSLDAQLTARAKALVSFLKDDTFCVGHPITDREFWDKLAADKSWQGTLRTAERALETPVAPFDDAMYLEFFENGNRSHFQTANGKRYAPLGPLVLAECMENKGRFLPKIEEYLRALAADKSWVLPAHDANKTNYRGVYTIDLTSSATAWTVATIAAWLGDRLSPEIRDLVDEQLESRCFVPFRSAICSNVPRLWWIDGKNNWNAVCLAGVTGAALTHLKDPMEKAWFLAAAEYAIRNSEDGYTDDGYCSEGVGYWCYGFGHHLRLAETVRRATNDKLRLLDTDKLRRVALYGFTIEIQPGIVPSFADCAINARPEPAILAYLNLYYRFGRDELHSKLNFRTNRIVDFGLFTSYDWPKPETSEETRLGEDVPGTRTWFPESQVLILRPAGETGISVAMKGGHNAELHNHNDVGSYTVVYGKTAPLLDLGGEVYTRRTFSKQRYESDLLNSWGHAVPVVAGKLQSTGSQAAATLQRMESSPETEVFAIDFAKAYDVPECRQLTRTFTYDRTGKTALTIEDSVAFTTPQTFETALVTASPWKQDGLQIQFGDDVTATVEVTVNGKPTSAWRLVESKYEADFPAKEKARRLGIVLNEPVSEATVRVTVTPR
ncbi:MAG: heparinase II/III family protein [Planctomycetia bacterium]|nr:heparinase II/III family protein [Planctomycetia bacterium]